MRKLFETSKIYKKSSDVRAQKSALGAYASSMAVAVRLTDGPSANSLAAAPIRIRITRKDRKMKTFIIRM